MKRFTRRLLAVAVLLPIVAYLSYLGAANALLRSGPSGWLRAKLNENPRHRLVTYSDAWTVWPGLVQVRGLAIRGEARSSQWRLTLDQAWLTIDLPRLAIRQVAVRAVHASGVTFRLRRRPHPATAATPATGAAAATAATGAAGATDEVTIAPGSPDIAGLPPSPAPPPPSPAQDEADARQAWRLLFHGVELDGVREVWIGGWHFAGEARLSGGFDAQPQRWLALDPLAATVRSGVLAVEARPALGLFSGSLQAEVGGFRPDGAKPADIFRAARGRLDMGGAMPDLAILQTFLRPMPWLRLGGSAGSWHAAIRAAGGRYAAGTRLEARPQRVTARLLDDDEAWGSGVVSWEVGNVLLQPGGWFQAPPTGAGVAGAADANHAAKAADGNAGAAAAGGAPGSAKARPASSSLGDGRLVVAFDELQLGRPGAPEPRAHGRGLRVEVATRGLDLAALPLPSALAIDMPPLTVGDFASYNGYIPRGAGLRLLGGAGSLQGWLRAAAPTWRGEGDITLDGRRIAADLQGHRLRGDLHLHSRFRALPRERQLALAASDVAVTDVIEIGPTTTGSAANGSATNGSATNRSMTNRAATNGTAASGPATPRAAVTSPAAPWSAHAHLDYAAVRPGSPIYLAGRLRATLSDARPLLALFPPGRRRILSWLDRLLHVQAIQASGELQATNNAVLVSGVATATSRLELRARLRFAAGRNDGDLYVAYGPLSVGLELQGGARNWQLFGARRWFDSRPPLRP